MGRYRRLEPEDERLWIHAKDKTAAMEEINRRNHLRGGPEDAIPYYLTGRPLRDSVPPTHLNGRLRTNSMGQMRHYLDWELAQTIPTSLESLTAPTTNEGVTNALKD